MSYGITKDEFYGRDLDSDEMIYLENAKDISEKNIVKTPRINIDYAKSKDCLLRFFIKDNPFISKK